MARSFFVVDDSRASLARSFSIRAALLFSIFCVSDMIGGASSVGMIDVGLRGEYVYSHHPVIQQSRMNRRDTKIVSLFVKNR